MPAHWNPRKEPAFLEAEALIRFKISVEPDHELVQKLSAQLEQDTGFRLAVVGAQEGRFHGVS